MNYPMRLPFVALAALQSVGALAQPTAMHATAALERTIEPSAGPGDPVTLRDAQCRYIGELVRYPAEGLIAGLTQAAGADGGSWQINVSHRVCGQIEQPVKLRVDLPKAPSLAGACDFPPRPCGYQAGTTFPLRTE